MSVTLLLGTDMTDIQSLSSTHQQPLFDPVLRIEAAAEYTGRTIKSIYDLFKRGELKKTKLGTRTSGVRLSELERWIAAQQEVETTPSIFTAPKKRPWSGIRKSSKPGLASNKKARLEKRSSK